MHQEDDAPHPIQASGVHLEITTSLEIKEINGAPTFDSPGSLPRMLAQEVTDIGLEYQR